MTKTIDTLVEDIYGLFGSEKEFSEELANNFGSLMAETMRNRVPAKNYGAELRMSNLGQPCERKLWYSVNLPPEEQEQFPPETRFKFLYGDILEEVVLYLAAEAGHTVEGIQDEMKIRGHKGEDVKGHRDAVIDGMLVDVKSASSYSFNRFSAGLTVKDDKFGYIDQLQQYLFASKDDPLVTIKDKAAFLVVDKTLGKICLDVHEKNGVDYNAVVVSKQEMLRDGTPDRGFSEVPEGLSGNQKLGVNCSYCAFKERCWPGLRTFMYSNGPRFLTRVAREPNVAEIGKAIEKPYGEKGKEGWG